MTLDEADGFIGEQEQAQFGQHDLWFQVAIAEKETDDLVGDLGVCIQSPSRTAEIGFSLAPSFQRRGYGLEACAAVIDLLFRSSSVEIVEAVVDARNSSAIALVMRLGMVLDRTDDALFKGEPCSEHRFVLRRSDEPRNAAQA